MSKSSGWLEAFQGLLEKDLFQLGSLIYDLHLQAGERYFHDQEEALLFSEAVFHSVQLLVQNRQMEAIFERGGVPQGEEADGASFATLAQVAQEIINRAFSEPYVYEPTWEERRARVRFAFKLDPTCGDAFLIQGAVEEHEDHLEAAKVAYEQAMKLATESLGEEVFSPAARKADNPPFWAAHQTRGYMRARQALAMVLWRQGCLKEATEHFEALIKLNPNDNQGNVDLLIDCLRELGDENLLQRALKRHRKLYRAEDRLLPDD